MDLSNETITREMKEKCKKNKIRKDIRIPLYESSIFSFLLTVNIFIDNKKTTQVISKPTIIL